LFENRTAQTTELLENQLINTLFAFILGTRQHRPPTKNVSEIHFVDSTWSEGIACVTIVGREILSTVKTTSSCQVLAYSLTAPPRTASNSRRVVCYVSGAPLGGELQAPSASFACFISFEAMMRRAAGQLADPAPCGSPPAGSQLATRDPREGTSHRHRSFKSRRHM